MAEDLNLSSSDYSILVLIFSVGYVIAEIPSNMILTRVRPSIFLPSIMIIWGTTVVLFSLVQNKQSLFILRFFLGLADGGLLAGFILEGLDGTRGISGWRWLFIIEGLITICIGVIVLFFLPDWPSTTTWLNSEEKKLASARLLPSISSFSSSRRNVNGNSDIEKNKNEKGEKSKSFFFLSKTVKNSYIFSNFLSVIKDYKVYLFCLLFNSHSISYFIPTITSSLGYKGNSAQFMSIPPYLIAIFCLLSVSFSSDILDEKPLHYSVPMLLSGIINIICIFVTNIKSRYVLVCFGYGINFGAFPVTLAWLSASFDQTPERNSIAQALMNSGKLIFSHYLWPLKDEPKFLTGFAFSSGFCILGSIASVLLHFEYLRPQQVKHC
ncbi:major facilitator superfamily domain-containing protein [Phakopsora pachyrhizi]|uniref:Major facilitator superfamily domain-containing protein n=1 Tax=Phakopsora pachyrhizi TaxID=170000 RepID=A0AAV0AUE1_PHAPC|nr:major facilitator superfamily domain-containing protein [Phakopsora pachyrhizi]